MKLSSWFDCARFYDAAVCDGPSTNFMLIFFVAAESFEDARLKANK